MAKSSLHIRPAHWIRRKIPHNPPANAVWSPAFRLIPFGNSGSDTFGIKARRDKEWEPRITVGHGIQGCMKLHRVAQTFESAGSRNFPVPRARRGPRTGDWKVALTSRLENLLYALDAALHWILALIDCFSISVFALWCLFPGEKCYPRRGPCTTPALLLASSSKSINRRPYSTKFLRVASSLGLAVALGS